MEPNNLGQVKGMWRNHLKDGVVNSGKLAPKLRSHVTREAWIIMKVTVAVIDVLPFLPL